jgi:enoyl-CoA hydratase/carnithine racemase
MSELIKIERYGRITMIILNRPEKRNAINMAMLDGIDEAIDEVKNDTNCSVVVLRGAGDQALSAGGDLSEFHSLQGAEIDHWIEKGHSVFQKIALLNIPTVAYIKGFALGGGLELALACDFRVAHCNCNIGLPEVSNGWLPGWGGIMRLKKIVSLQVLKQVTLLSPRLNAQQALEMGILDFIVNEDADVFDVLVSKLAKINPVVYDLAKTELFDFKARSLAEQIKFDIAATIISTQYLSHQS